MRLQKSGERASSLHFFELSPAEYAAIREQSLEATSSALTREKLREDTRQSRLRLFMTTLDPVALEREAQDYQKEQTAFSNKDPIFWVGQYLFDFWSTPTPDTVESRRIRALKATGMHFQEGDWYRPALLKIFVEGRKLLENGDPKSAEAFFSRVVLRAAHFASGWYLRGRARLGQGLSEPALQDFLEAERLDPSRPEYNRWAAVVLENLGRKREAVDHLRKALSKDSDYPEARTALDRLGN